MAELRVMPHFMQSIEKRNCGAACLAMLLKHYRMRGKVSDITKEISGLSQIRFSSCRNNLVIQYALKHKLNCSVVSVKDVREFIPFCLQRGLEMFISYHTDPTQPIGHFVLVTNADNAGVYVNDPACDAQEGVNKQLSYEDLIVRMKHLGIVDEITRPNVVVLFSKKNQDIPITYVTHNENDVMLFTDVLDKITAYVDPYKDCWVDIEDNIICADTNGYCREIGGEQS